MKKGTAYNKSILPTLTVACIVLVLISSVFTSTVLAKYASQQQNQYSISASSFYFSSNELEEAGGEGVFNGTLIIYLYNFSGSNNSSYDIEYTVIVSDIITAGDDSVTVTDDNNGVLQGNTSSTSTVSITPHDDVTNFTITVNTTNGYSKTLFKIYSK